MHFALIILPNRFSFKCKFTDNMLENFLTQTRLFFFVLASFYLIIMILHTVSVFSLKRGKIIQNKFDAWAIAISLSYVITILISGF